MLGVAWSAFLLYQTGVSTKRQVDVVVILCPRPAWEILFAQPPSVRAEFISG